MYLETFGLAFWVHISLSNLLGNREVWPWATTLHRPQLPCKPVTPAISIPLLQYLCIHWEEPVIFMFHFHSVSGKLLFLVCCVCFLKGGKGEGIAIPIAIPLRQSQNKVSRLVETVWTHELQFNSLCTELCYLISHSLGGRCTKTGFFSWERLFFMGRHSPKEAVFLEN